MSQFKTEPHYKSVEAFEREQEIGRKSPVLNVDQLYSRE